MSTVQSSGLMGRYFDGRYVGSRNQDGFLFANGTYGNDGYRNRTRTTYVLVVNCMYVQAWQVGKSSHR
jgi:hypothetical protein